MEDNRILWQSKVKWSYKDYLPTRLYFSDDMLICAFNHPDKQSLLIGDRKERVLEKLKDWTILDNLKNIIVILPKELKIRLEEADNEIVFINKSTNQVLYKKLI